MIPAGPTWTIEQDHGPDGAPYRPDLHTCPVCGELSYVDKATRLCQPCYRVWYFTRNLAGGGTP